MTLLAKFSITSLVLLAVMGVLLGNTLTHHFEQEAIDQQKTGVSSLVPPVVGPYLTDELLSKGAQGDTYKQIENALSYLGGSGLVRVKILNKSGRIVYSDDPTLVGKLMPVAGDLQQALDGVPTASLSQGSSADNIDAVGYGELLAVHTPLRKAGESQVSAVFEGYYDVGDLQQTISDTSIFLWTSIAAGLVFLFISLFTLVRNASQTLRRQSKENEHLYQQAQQRLSEREEAERGMERQMERLKALRNIDVAIASNLDMRLTLHVILAQVCTQLQVDAASILLLNKQTQMLEYIAGRGFGSDGIDRFSIKAGEGYTGRVALEHLAPQVIAVSKMDDAGRAHLLAEERFVSYSVASLVVKGQLKGVLEVFHRSELKPGAEWLGFFETLAGQAAIAVENASLFEDLQHSNTELSQAYDSTLEGWSRALDLRDEETEGHSRRVTEMSMRLARQMGVPESDLLHIRRGALLHDIGKMGIPDSILLKSGPLTDDEWKVMKQHPTYAYLLLSPITFLRPAIDIPYCHHEKWDGTGYPRRLKGEQIPLAARIFAVVDVWDALGSDRPYRKAVPTPEIHSYLQQQSGKHFDPDVVEAFLGMEKPDFALGRFGRSEPAMAVSAAVGNL